MCKRVQVCFEHWDKLRCYFALCSDELGRDFPYDERHCAVEEEDVAVYDVFCGAGVALSCLSYYGDSDVCYYIDPDVALSANERIYRLVSNRYAGAERSNRLIVVSTLHRYLFGLYEYRRGAYNLAKVSDLINSYPDYASDDLSVWSGYATIEGLR